LKPFDWHRDRITRDTPITSAYRNTQNARRFFEAQCDEHFRFDRSFMSWLKSANNETMGGAVKGGCAVISRRALHQERDAWVSSR
jgi:hypothetical protein